MKLKEMCSFVSLMFQRRSFKELVTKNIELLFGYPLYAISFLIPRIRRKWLVGSHIGFAGNSKYFFIDVNNQHRSEIQCIWIANNRKEKKNIQSLNLPVCYRWSLKGLYHCLTAGIYVSGFHLIDINFWTSGGVKRVNLWHGVGIKNIEFKTKLGSGKFTCNEKNIISRIYLPYQFKRPHLFLSTSPLMTEHFMECFRIGRERCLEYLYPRCAIFFWEKEKLKIFINQYESEESKMLIKRLEQCSKSYLYMPTWREKRNNYVEDALFDYDLLNEVLRKRNEIFLLKLHPEEVFLLNNSKEYSNIIIVDKKIDIYPILPFTSVLITDYSSIYYDYILMKEKNILLFPFDYKEYITEDRDLAFDFNEFTPGKRVYTFKELLNCIINDSVLDFPEKGWIREQFWGKNITKNPSEKIYELLYKKWVG